MTETKDKCTYVKEGKASILFPSENSVFYNPVQEFNRDVTIAVITEFIKAKLKKDKINAVEFPRNDSSVISLNDDNCSDVTIYPGEKLENGVRILEALSATGLRSVRFAKELPGVKQIVANDLSEDAFHLIKQNIDHNNVCDVVEANQGDATTYMYINRGKSKEFDVIDIDPYGSAACFLDSAVQAVKPGGLLCVTCTDMAVMAGNFPGTCWAKYQSVPLKTKACHEQALRMVLSAISSHAARYSRYIVPLLSLSVDFYVRIFVQVHYKPSIAQQTSSKQIKLYRCVGCSSFHSQHLVDRKGTDKNPTYFASVGPPVGERCLECNHRHKIGGPYWGSAIHDLDFVNKVLTSVKSFPTRFGTAERIIGMLSMVVEELPDIPFYYVTDELSMTLRCGSPPSKLIRSAILNAGYRVSGFHGRVNSIKTDAPPTVIWDIMRTWGQSQAIKTEKLKEDSAAKFILNKEIETKKIDFTEHKDADSVSKVKGIVRFPNLPANWGPKSRAKSSKDGGIELSLDLKEKSKKFQGKRGKNNKDYKQKSKKMKTT
uniref:tRNA (guanine(26)-N(2))-dimethyltransferase n=1 Tax=Ciona savignyi TaxID=51511 RepID=H2ZLY0_CIOSA